LRLYRSHYAKNSIYNSSIRLYGEINNNCYAGIQHALWHAINRCIHKGKCKDEIETDLLDLNIEAFRFITEEHNRKVIEAHPMFKRIELIEGNSILEETVEKIRKVVPKGSKVIVCLYSNHRVQMVA